MNYEVVRKNLMQCVNILKGVQLLEVRERQLRNHRRNVMNHYWGKEIDEESEMKLSWDEEEEITLKKEKSLQSARVAYITSSTSGSANCTTHVMRLYIFN